MKEPIRSRTLRTLSAIVALIPAIAAADELAISNAQLNASLDASKTTLTLQSRQLDKTSARVTFPRKIAYYSLQEKVLPLEQAIRSMTGLPAEILSMTDRGTLKEGLAADVVVFDPKRLKDTATFDDPHQYAAGIEYVFVNGQPALVRGRPTGALAGKALRFNK